jgi:hypothetical protein
VDYLEHPSQHSDAFIAEVDQHLHHLSDVEAFADKHDALTQPGGVGRTYTKDELDRMVADSVQRAVRDAQSTREQTFTRSELDAEIQRSVDAAMAKFNAGKGST